MNQYLATNILILHSPFVYIADIFTFAVVALWLREVKDFRLHCKLGHQNVIHEILKKHSIPFMNKFRFATSLSRRWFCSTFVFKLSTIYLGFNN